MGLEPYACSLAAFHVKTLADLSKSPACRDEVYLRFNVGLGPSELALVKRTREAVTSLLGQEPPKNVAFPARRSTVAQSVILTSFFFYDDCAQRENFTANDPCCTSLVFRD